jgi:hypothetical protein
MFSEEEKLEERENSFERVPPRYFCGNAKEIDEKLELWRGNGESRIVNLGLNIKRSKGENETLQPRFPHNKLEMKVNMNKLFVFWIIAEKVIDLWKRPPGL